MTAGGPAIPPPASVPDARALPAQLLRKGVGTLVLKVAGQALLLGAMVLLARLLGDRSYGQYVYVLAWVRVCVVLVKTGYDAAVLRFLPAYVVQEEWSLAHGLVRRALAATAGVWGVVAAVGAAALALAAGRLEPGLLPVAALGLGVLLAQAVADQLASVLQALHHVVRSFFPNFVLRPALVGLLALAAVAAGLPRTGALAMAATLGASLGCLVLLALWLRRLLPAALRAAPPAARDRAWLRTAGGLLLVSAVQLVMAQTDTIMVGTLLDTTAAGYYGTASRLAGLVLFGLIAASGYAAPLISSLHAAGDRAGLQRMLEVTARGVLVFTVPVVLVLVLGGRALLGLWGPGFDAAYGALVLLTAAHAVNAWAGPAGYVLTMTGHELVPAACGAGATLLNVGLNLLLIPHLGLAGAGAATGVAVVFLHVCLVLFARRRLRLNTTPYWPVRA